MDWYISLGLTALIAIASVWTMLPALKYIQLSGYGARKMIDYVRSTGYDLLIRYVSLTVFGIIAMFVYIACFSVFKWARYAAEAIYLLLAVVFVVSVEKRGDSDVRFTRRAVRLLILSTFILCIIAALIAWATYVSVYCQSLVAVMGLAAPLSVMAANLIASPFEKLNNRKYIKAAKKKLAERKPVVIGITGSFGKTTAKNILYAMLSEEYSALATPESFNTPMGVCKTINDKLGDEKFFIAELGARRKGDIKELCDIVSPTVGIITAVGDMHLETFGDRAGVADAKYELAEALSENGTLILNGYNAPCLELKARRAPCKAEIASETAEYKNLKLDSRGTSFTLVLDGKEYDVVTALLGRHIAELSVTCALAARRLGVSPEAIVKAIENMPPVEHRLSLMGDGESIVIDDAYNSNPVGAKNALDVLALFEGKKIIITPGFVELGAIEKECNIALGGDIAKVCDYALLVGSRAADIKKGAINAGMQESCIRLFDHRDEAVKELETIAGSRVVLFENDLPDNIK